MTWSADENNGGFGEAKPWLPVKQPQQQRAADTQVGVDDSVFETYRELLKIRSGSEALRTGATEYLHSYDTILDFIRGGEVQCIFNLSAESKAYTAKAGQVLISNAAQHNGNEWHLQANGFVLLSLS